MMKLKKIAKLQGGQDGAIWGSTLFRFDTKGGCRVYALDDTIREIGQFRLDRADEIIPHSNAVVFGPDYYEECDEFPLLYTNIYNNYAKETDRKVGMCLVYRLQRTGDGFTSTLVQQIRIGFVSDANWSTGEDIRPYGNFVIDPVRRRYWAYVMRDADQLTRYFAFDLPVLTDGFEVVLEKEAIREWFDTPYHHFIQGGCLHDGKIYSVEGFTDNVENPAGLRIIDTLEHKQITYMNLAEMGYPLEPEMVDFCGEVCYYSDGHGNVYIVE